MSYKVKDILEQVEHIKFIGNENQQIDKPISFNFENIDPTVLMW